MSVVKGAGRARTGLVSAAVMIAFVAGAGSAHADDPPAVPTGQVIASKSVVAPNETFVITLPECTANLQASNTHAVVEDTDHDIRWEYISDFESPSRNQDSFNAHLPAPGVYHFEASCQVVGYDEPFDYGTIDITVADPARDTLPAGSELVAGDALVAGDVKLVMQGDGNLVAYNAAGKATWSSGSSGNPGAKAAMQSDGNFVVYSAAGKALWQSGTAGNRGAQVVIGSDGIVGVYAAGSDKALWSSAPGTVTPPAQAKDTLTTNQRLTAGTELVSRNGTYKLAMQKDGNFVLYGGGKVLWAANSYPAKDAYTVVQGDGNVVVYDAASKAYWQSGTNAGVTLVVQNDGNVVLYSKAGAPVWWTGTGR